jgi:hypothetical protein
MKNHNSSESWKTLAAGLSVFVAVGSLTYLGLSGGGKQSPQEDAEAVRRDHGSESTLASGFPGVAQVGTRSPAVRAGTPAAPRTTALLVGKAAVEGSPLIAGGPNPDLDKGRVLRLKPANIQKWGAVAKGERVLLPTVSGEELYGTVNVVVSDPGWFRMGGTLEGTKGTFHLNASSNEVHGGIYFPELGVGHQIQMDGEDVVLVERRLSALICSPGIKREGEGILRDRSSAVARAPSAQVIPQINTRPSAKGVIYIDFAGGVINSVAWGGPITASPSDLTGESITQVANRVAECFSPFDVTITTIANVHQQTPNGRRMRVVVTPTDTAGPGSGGVAIIGSWRNGGSDTVCWVFNQSVRACADAVSHEVGHTLGLKHHGRRTGMQEYYAGHGGGLSVPTSWGPIMGAPYGVSLTQWSNGQYYDANNSGQDDLQIISSGNNFSYVSALGSYGTVRSLPLSGPLFQTSGTLISRLDSHVYQFSTTGGKLSASVRPASSVGTGDFRLDLLDGNGVGLAVADPAEVLGGAISRTLVAGVYRLKVVPTGTGEAPTGGYRVGYSAYGSLGGYSLTGTIEGANSFPAFLNTKLIAGTEGVPMSVKFEVTDPTKTTVTKLSQNLPTGVMFDTGTSVLSGTPPAGASGGAWSLTLMAKSSVGETRTQFNVVISEQSLGLSSALGAAVTDISTPPTGPWIGVRKDGVDGTPTIVAQSGPIMDKGTSSIRCSYSAPSGSASPWSVMTFYWQSDTEEGKDVVQCRVDGVVARDMITGRPLLLSGNTGWVKQTVLLSGVGKRNIEFAYAKNENLKSGQDKVWVYGVKVGQPPVVNAPPVRTLRVTPGTKLGSDNFTLSAVVTGAKTLAWWKNGVPLANGTSQSGSVISGVSTGTLAVTGAKAADAGVYWLVAKNDSGAVASGRCEVVLWVPPVVTAQPVTPIGLKVGDPLTLTADVRGAQPIYYQWRKDGVPGRWSSSPYLVIQRITAASAGKYVLVAVNPSGTVSSEEVTVRIAQPTAGRASAAK